MLSFILNMRTEYFLPSKYYLELIMEVLAKINLVLMRVANQAL